MQQLTQGGSSGTSIAAVAPIRRLPNRCDRYGAGCVEWADELSYFARDLLLDRFGRFFYCGVSVSSNGRCGRSAG